jgi:hypothetical protein
VTTQQRTRRATGGIVASAAVALLLWGTPALAQAASDPPWQIAISYSYLQEQGLGGAPSTTYPKGWVATVGRQLGHGRFAVVGEVSDNHRTNLVVETASLYGFLGGLRIDLVRFGPARLFVQGLVGLERFVEPGLSERGLALQPGVGVDLAVTRRIAIRAEGDFRAAREEGVTFREARGTFGLVIGAGR